MNIYFAVFNVRDPELRKARIAFNKQFGKGSYAKNIAPFVRKGIMSIFQVPPTEKTRWYVEFVAQLVNARVGEAAKQSVHPPGCTCAVIELNDDPCPVHGKE